jgi:D-alanyl-D-alanine dipeptidase
LQSKVYLAIFAFMDLKTRERRFYLQQYLRLLTEQGLLKPEDATCKMFALIDDDRLALPVPSGGGGGGEPLKTRTHVLADLEANPKAHEHTFEELRTCCIVSVGTGAALDLTLLDAHAKFVDLGTNNGERCDVIAGPCACGETHHHWRN